MKDRYKSYAFTLIELLVVILVIAILMALLMPSLARAKYRAKEVICMNNIKQQVIGLMSYTSDNEGYYPGLKMSNNARFDYNVGLANPGGGVQFSELLEDYWGSEAVRFENTGSIVDDPLKLPPNTWMPDPRYVYGDYLQYFGYQEHAFGDKTDLRGEAMKKVGDSYQNRYNVGKPRITALLSDITNRFTDHPYKSAFASHNDMDSIWEDPNSSSGWFLQTYRRTARYAAIYPRMSGHFADQDGSVLKYVIPAYSYEGFVKYSVHGQIVPKELTE